MLDSQLLASRWWEEGGLTPHFFIKDKTKHNFYFVMRRGEEFFLVSLPTPKSIKYGHTFYYFIFG